MPAFRLFILLSGVLPALAFAQTPPPSSPPSLIGHMGQMLLGLGVVLILLFICLWVIKRLSSPRGGASGLKVVGGTSVGPKERIVLVEIGKTVLVLGVTSGSISTLHQMTTEELSAANTSSVPIPAVTGSPFSSWLKQAMEKQKNG